MTRRRRDPLRPRHVSLGLRPRAAHPRKPRPLVRHQRARALLAVADGHTYAEAAAVAGRRAGDTVAAWVARFNRAGLAALEPGHGGGPPVRYGAAARARIPAEVPRPPRPERDGAAPRSGSTPARARRRGGGG